MDLATEYLGLKLAHPLIAGASPMVDDLSLVRRLEDAGAAAIVMHSLFEEQLEQEQLGYLANVAAFEESFPEAPSFLPSPDGFTLGPEEYLERVRRLKETVAVPVIASLNGRSPGGWLKYGRLIEQAGADALELNVFDPGADPARSAADLEDELLAMVASLRADLSIPLAVKLSPWHASLANLARRLAESGARGLVLFNRFFEPWLDVEELRVESKLRLSDSSELPLRLRWLGILRGRVQCSLAATGGVHDEHDAVRAIMAGADAVQMVSALLLHGPERLATVRERMVAWMLEREYGSIGELRASLSLERCPDPAAYQRANYLRMLQSWRV